MSMSLQTCSIVYAAEDSFGHQARVRVRDGAKALFIIYLLDCGQDAAHFVRGEKLLKVCHFGGVRLLRRAAALDGLEVVEVARHERLRRRPEQRQKSVRRLGPQGGV
eukprot:559664-Prorocentrum_minimum.AAC.1